MLKKTLFTLAILLVSISLFAQVPGYKGKKLMVKYDFGTMQNWFQPQNYTWWKFHTHHHFQLDYVVTTDMSLGLDYEYGNNNLNLGTTRVSGEKVKLQARAISHTFTGYLKLYNRGKGALAPIGPYQRIGISGILYKAGDIHKNTPCDPFLGYDCAEAASFLGDFGILYGFGRSFVIFDRVLLDLSYEGGLPFATIIRAREYQESLTQIIARRYATGYAFQVRIGIGFLAF